MAECKAWHAAVDVSRHLNHRATRRVTSLCVFVGLISLVAGACQNSATPKPRRQSSPSEARPRTVQDDHDIRELAIRYYLDSVDPDETVFLSFGRDGNGGWIDPPPEFIRRFRDIPANVRPVSAAGLLELNPLTEFRGFEDPETGKISTIYWAEIKKWVTDIKVKVDTGLTSGPLSGGGAVLMIKHRNRRWVITDEVSGWIS